MPNLNVSLNVSLLGTLESILDVNSATQQLAYGANYPFTPGNGANQAQNVFTDIRTLAASANESLDLNGVLTDAFGAVINFTKIKAILIRADAANTNDVLFGPAAANGFVTPFNAAADRIRLKPGGTAVLIAPDANGYAVTPGTGDLLAVANSGAGSAVNYTVIIIGV